MVDASTQVYARNKNRPPMVSTIPGAYYGEREVADWGVCDFRVCFSKGCGRSFSRELMVQPDPDVEDDNFMQNICLECESRANRAFYATLLIVFLLAALVALPFILLTGGATYANSVTAI